MFFKQSSLVYKEKKLFKFVSFKFMFSSLIFYIYICVLHFLMFYVHFLSIKELALLVFGYSISNFQIKEFPLLVFSVFLFVFLYKGVTFISFILMNTVLKLILKTISNEYVFRKCKKKTSLMIILKRTILCKFF